MFFSVFERGKVLLVSDLCRKRDYEQNYHTIMLKKTVCLLLAAAPIGAVQAQQLRIVAGAPDTTYTATLNLRGVATAGTQISVQGETFPVYSSGEWAARVELTEGDNTVTLTTTDGQSVSKNIFLKKREAPQPIDGPRAENVQILPSSDMALSPGDAVRIRLNAAPGAKIAWIGGEPLYEVSQGVFQGQYTVQPGDTLIGRPIELSIAWGDTTAVQGVESSLELIEGPMPRIVQTKAGAYLNYGLGGDRLGGAKINYLAEGIKLQVVGRVNQMYKVRLSRNTVAWIPVSCTEPMPEGTFAPESLTDSWSVTTGGKYDQLTVGLFERLPYIITEDPDLHRINIDLYGAACNTNWITQLKGEKEIANVSYRQVQDDVLRVIVELRDSQMWGYSVGYRGNSLVVRVKHRPESLKLSNLTIAVDAGHGEPWNGARTTSGVKEQDLTKDMAEHLKKVLESKGAKVILTRPGTENVDMDQRKAAALEGGADILISIHCNAGGSPFAAKGTSTYYRHLSQRPLSVYILESILEMDVNNFGNIGNFNFSLNQPTEYLTVLVETLFLSSPEDSAKILDKRFRDEMMDRVAWGLEKFLASVPGSDAKAPKKFKPSK